MTKYKIVYHYHPEWANKFLANAVTSNGVFFGQSITSFEEAREILIKRLREEKDKSIFTVPPDEEIEI